MWGMNAPGIIEGVRDSLAIGREALSGALLVWRQVPALLDLAALSDARLRTGFEGDPLTAGLVLERSGKGRIKIDGPKK